MVSIGQSLAANSSQLGRPGAHRATKSSQPGHQGQPDRASRSQIEPARAPGAARASQSRPDRASKGAQALRKCQARQARQASSRNFVMDVGMTLGHTYLRTGEVYLSQQTARRILNRQPQNPKMDSRERTDPQTQEFWWWKWESWESSEMRSSQVLSRIIFVQVVNKHSRFRLLVSCFSKVSPLLMEIVSIVLRTSSV